MPREKKMECSCSVLSFRICMWKPACIMRNMPVFSVHLYLKGLEQACIKTYSATWELNRYISFGSARGWHGGGLWCDQKWMVSIFIRMLNTSEHTLNISLMLNASLKNLRNTLKLSLSLKHLRKQSVSRYEQYILNFNTKIFKIISILIHYNSRKTFHVERDFCFKMGLIF